MYVMQIEKLKVFIIKNIFLTLMMLLAPMKCYSFIKKLF